VEIQPERIDSRDALELFAELDQLLNGLYVLETDLLELSPAELSEGRWTFLLARDDCGNPVGCGAIRRIAPATGELKRMYVRPVARRHGVGCAILEALERWAFGAGLEWIVLETGIHQPAAMAFYELAGYVRIPRYAGGGGREQADPEQSVCYGKRRCTGS
jgi:putative acetyltransferase